MTQDVHISPAALAAIEMPAQVRDALLSTGVPATFDRFAVDCDVSALHVESRGPERFLILGSTDAGALAVRLIDGSVWWLLAAVLDGRPELRHAGDEQFINSDLRAYQRCVHGWEDLLANDYSSAEPLRAQIEDVDPTALELGQEGVWRDVLADWEAGL